MKTKPAFWTVLIAGILFSSTFNCKKESIKTIPIVILQSVTNITSNSASTGGEVTSDGGAAVMARGVCWNTTQNPTISNYTTSNGPGKGSFVSSLTGLLPGTTYYLKSYGRNAIGTGYSIQSTFTTLPVAPVLTTTDLSAVTSTSATSGGNITNDGGSPITARGLCWSNNQNPNQADSLTKEGTGSGSFTSVIKSLSPGITYYFRAYATNSAGTSYGNQLTLTTIAVLPIITTTTPSEIASTSANSGGNITSDGGSAIKARGICWSAKQNPSIADSITTDGSGIGSYTTSLTGLTPGKTYYVRAYATNNKGTAYGDPVVSFTTSVLPVIPEKYGMVFVQGGTFLMGSTTGNIDETPVHSVTLSSFYISKYELTQALWQEVMGSNPASFKGSDLPVETVGWNDIQSFITKLMQKTGLSFRLPTEAEWEFAARGGISSNNYTYSGSNTADNVAWDINNSVNTSHSIGQKSPNELGLYDMSGNVWEWCADWKGPYSGGAQTNPAGPDTADTGGRVFRGGSWYGNASYCRVAFRGAIDPSLSFNDVGFRLALSSN